MWLLIVVLVVTVAAPVVQMHIHLLGALVLLVFVEPLIEAHWWLTSQVFTVGSRSGCSNIAGLVREQKMLCKRYPTLMEVVGFGAR